MLEQTIFTWLSVALALAAAGAIAGFLAGLLGVGGGIVIVPVLYSILPLLHAPENARMHIAVATSLATIIATSLASVRAHHRNGGIDVPIVRRLAPTLFLGAALGAALGGKISSDILAGLFALLALLVAIKTAFARDDMVLCRTFPRGAVASAIGFCIGALSVLMGIGGGAIGVPILVSCKLSILRAVGTASTFGFLIAIPGVVGYMLTGWKVEGLPIGSLGYVNLMGVALIIPMTMLIAPLGANLAHTIAPKYLRYAFASLLALTSLRMGYGVFN